MRAHAFLVMAVLGCGDNEPLTCEVPPGVLPVTGEYIDPYALPLPADCIEGGLRFATGRWFVRDPNEIFMFEYPRIEGNCRDGFKRTGSEPDDPDVGADGSTRHTWSDGTRFFQRAAWHYETPQHGLLSYIDAMVMCSLPDDRVAAVFVQGWTGTSQLTISSAIGTRFAPKDEGADGLELVGELAQTPQGKMTPYNLVVVGGYAYLAGPTGLDIVDVTDPATPVHVGHLDGSYNDVRVVYATDRRYAILAPISGNETVIADVTSAAAPQVVAFLPYAHSLFVQQRGTATHLYLIGSENFIPTYDITNPKFPLHLGGVRLSGILQRVHDAFVDGDIVYANHGLSGFVAMDISTGLSSAVELARMRSGYSHASWRGRAGGREIVLHGDEGMTGTKDGAAFLRVLDADRTSPTFMTEIGRYQSSSSVGIHNFEMHGERVYIAYYQDGVRVVDLSDPTEPVEVAHYNTWDDKTSYGASFEGALGIRVVDGLIYVADDVRGLLILRED